MRERLNTLMELLDMTPTQFAAAIGVQRPTLQHIISGRNDPSLKIVISIHNAFPDIDLDWLLNGTGTPRKTASLEDSLDYPLFSGADSGLFPPTAGKESEFSNVRRETKAPKHRKNTDKEKVEMQNPINSTCGSKHIKEVVVFFEDGTYQKFQSELKK